MDMDMDMEVGTGMEVGMGMEVEDTRRTHLDLCLLQLLWWEEGEGEVQSMRLLHTGWGLVWPQGRCIR